MVTTSRRELAARLLYLNREEARVKRYWLNTASKAAKLRSIEAEREALHERLSAR